MSSVGLLADEYWAYYRSTDQLWNIDRGDVDQIERWDDLSPDGLSQRIQRLQEMGAKAEQLSRSVPAGSDAAILATLASIAFSAGATAAGLPWMRDRSML